MNDEPISQMTNKKTILGLAVAGLLLTNCGSGGAPAPSPMPAPHIDVGGVARYSGHVNFASGFEISAPNFPIYADVDFDKKTIIGSGEIPYVGRGFIRNLGQLGNDRKLNYLCNSYGGDIKRDNCTVQLGAGGMHRLTIDAKYDDKMIIDGLINHTNCPANLECNDSGQATLSGEINNATIDATFDGDFAGGFRIHRPAP